MSAKVAELLFRAALLLYPRDFRARFAESMLDCFEERTAEKRAAGVFAGLGCAMRESALAAVSGLRERHRPSIKKPAEACGRRRRPTMKTRLAVLAKEAQFALRSFRKSPGFTLLAVATLALGVGANSAIFSVVNGVLLEPLPYEESRELLSVMSLWSGPGGGRGGLSYPDLADVESESPAIASLVGFSTTGMTLTEVGEPSVVEVTRVTRGLFDVFRVAPALGRDIRADEFGGDGPRVVVVGHGFWSARLGGRLDVVGETLTLDAIPHEIVGVAPPGFDFPEAAELWIPLRLDLEDCGRGCHTMRGIGRLASGATLDSARAEVDRIARNLTAAYPDTNTHKGFLVRSLQEYVVGDVRHGLLLLLGAVALVLLIACANVANLLLVRASNRTGEIAIRTALGASRARVVAQTLVESGLLAILGGAAGLAVAAASLSLLLGLATGLPRVESVGIDGRVLLFTLGSLLVVTFLFGAAPAFALLRSDVRAGLSQGSSRSGAGREKRRFRSLLLGFETGLAALLLVAAGLLLKTFHALYAVDLGFETENLSRFSMILPEARYDSLEKLRLFYRNLEESIRALPGVESVGSVWSPPLGRSRATGNVLVTGRPEPPPEEERSAEVHPTGPGFLETMGIRVLRGRGLLPEDDVGPERVALVNETFVRENFPAEDPLGREFALTVDLGYGSPAWRIVGVVSNVHTRALDVEPEPQVYVPHGLYGPERMTVTVRSRPGTAIVPAVREILHRMDASVPLYRVETLSEVVEREVAPTRFYLVLIAVFAGIAATLASVGIYGVVAYAAACRTREIGLRFALGAQRGSVLRLVVSQGLKPTTLGMALGLGAAYLGGRFIEAVLFGVDPRDPAIFLLTILLLGGVSLLATLLPARRASRIDPASALRSE